MNGLGTAIWSAQFVVFFEPGCDITRYSWVNAVYEDGFLYISYSSENTFGVEESTNSESDKILSEASAVAESQAGEKFPDMPMMDQINMPSSSTESKFM